MLTFTQRINAFEKLGEFLTITGLQTQQESGVGGNTLQTELVQLIAGSHRKNPWFIKEYVTEACVNTGKSLKADNLQRWIGNYTHKIKENADVKTIGVVMAGNIPMVGFHDFLCVLISGNRIIAKLSSDDNQLMRLISKKLIELDPGFGDYIHFTESRLENFDAVIATGSNNTSRYFDYYFRKYPHIIRKNRNGIAVLTGDETQDDLVDLGKDMLLYFGMGCRSISKLFVPQGYSFDRLFQSLEPFRFLADHHKFHNNYEYYKSIFLINGDAHLDTGFLLFKPDPSYASPPSVIYYEEYTGLNTLLQKMKSESNQIQCIIADPGRVAGAVPFGSAQKPELWDYADGVDTMEFLLNLSPLQT